MDTLNLPDSIQPKMSSARLPLPLRELGLTGKSMLYRSVHEAWQAGWRAGWRDARRELGAVRSVVQKFRACHEGRLDVAALA